MVAALGSNDKKMAKQKIQFVEPQPSIGNDGSKNRDRIASDESTTVAATGQAPKAATKIFNAGSNNVGSNNKMMAPTKSVNKLTTFRIGGRRAILAALLGKEAPKPVYTIDKLECTIYDNTHHDNETMLLMPESLIPIKPDPVDNCVYPPPPNLLRFLTDVSAQHADFLMVLSVMGTCISTPFTFVWGGKWSSDSDRVPGAPWTFIFDFVMDLIYAAHLLLQLNTSYMDPLTRSEVVDRKQIREHLFSNPVYWIKVLGTTSYFWIACGSTAFFNNVKVVRVMHVRQLPDSLWEITDSPTWRMWKPILLLVICSHWVACVLSCIGGYREKLFSAGEKDLYFSSKFDGKKVDHHIAAYLMAFIETLYMLTGTLDNPLGDGGPREKNFGSLLLVAIFGPIGCVVAAMVIAAIVREQALANVLEIRHAENKAFISRALKILNIPKALQVRVFSLHYFQRMSHDFEAFEHLFNNKHLSAPLDIALRVYLNNENVVRARYFDGKDLNYILEVVRILEDCVFLPGDYVARCGEVGTQMYFVARGRLTVLIPSTKNRNDVSAAAEIRTLKKTDYFGDVALLKDCTRTAWVRADSYCLLSMLTRQAIEEIWRYFPNERTGLIENVKGRIKEVRKQATEGEHWKKVHSKILAVRQMSAASQKLSPAMRPNEPQRLQQLKEAQPLLPSTGMDSHSEANASSLPLVPGTDPVEVASLVGDDVPAPGEEDGADDDDLGVMPQRTAGCVEAITPEDLKKLANRVDSACEALIRNQYQIQRKVEALQSRVANLTAGQEELAKFISGDLNAGIKLPTPQEDQVDAPQEDSSPQCKSPNQVFKQRRKKKAAAPKSSTNKAKNEQGNLETVISD